MSLALDWLTLKAAVPPRMGKRWHGSVEWGRFESLVRPGLRVGARYNHGHFEVEMTGEFFRCGGDFGEVVSDVWGNPPPPLGAIRVDCAREFADTAPINEYSRGVNVRAVAEEVLARVPPARWGWTIDERRSEDGWTCYVVIRGQTPGEALEKARARPLFIRVYQKARGPLRCEVECKELSGHPASECVEAAFKWGAHLFGSPSGWSVDQSTQIERLGRLALDGRAQPEKLLKQAWGFIRTADARQNGRHDDPELRREFARLYFRVTGKAWEHAESGHGRGPGESFGAYLANRAAHVGVPVSVIQGTEIAEPPEPRQGKFWAMFGAGPEAPGE